MLPSAQVTSIIIQERNGSSLHGFLMFVCFVFVHHPTQQRGERDSQNQAVLTKLKCAAGQWLTSSRFYPAHISPCSLLLSCSRGHRRALAGNQYIDPVRPTQHEERAGYMEASWVSEIKCFLRRVFNMTVRHQGSFEIDRTLSSVC